MAIVKIRIVSIFRSDDDIKDQIVSIFFSSVLCFLLLDRTKKCQQSNKESGKDEAEKTTDNLMLGNFLITAKKFPDNRKEIS